MYNKILLATDGSDHSLRTVDHAIQLAKTSDNPIIEIIYVKDMTKVKSETLNNWNQVTTSLEERFSTVEKKVKEANVSYKMKVLNGEPGPTVVEYVNKNQFDVVIVGSRGLNALQEMVLGSVSHKVAKRANCPVFIIK
ncbi:universal stress protein [Aquibacillus sediminis]|uniref:universal stress protein n=1 Tax=Aquibacillus sediminis TaxID=2574734 RepID=UPI0011086A01|nr:universal stress protein [Aquibacillus sediminis]